MKKHFHCFRYVFSLILSFVLLSGFLQQKVSALIIVSTDDITSSSVRIFWGPVAGATEYRVIVFGFDMVDYVWRNYPGYPVVVKSPNNELIVNNIGYFDPFWDDDRKIRVEAYANGTLLDKGEKDIVLPEPGPVITGITNATYNSFTVSWSKTIGGNLVPWQEVSLSVSNEETGEVAASFKDLTATSQVVTGLPGGTRYVIRLRGYKKIYLSYYDEWLEIWSDVTVGYVYTKLETPVALPGISMRPNAFMAQWNKTSGAKKYKLYVREKATGRMVINGDSTTVLSWWVDGLESGQEYEYQVLAKNAIQESPKSNTIKVTTEALETPVAKQPTNVTDHSFKAWWNPVAGATKYRLEIFIDNNWAWRFTTETSFEVSDLPLQPNTTYKYRVRAIFNTKLSYYGNEITVKTRPRAPVALQATNITNTSFTARWQPVSGATGYKLWVISTASTGLSPQGYFPKTLGNVDNHTVAGLASGIEYLYYIQTLVSGGESTVSASIYVTTTGATTYAVNLSASPAAGGVVGGGGTFAPGKSVTLAATANPGYEFVNWTEGTKVLSSNAGYSFTVSANRTLVANFRSLPAQCVVTLSANPADGGTVSGDGTYQEGSSVSVKASTAEGYEFVNWTSGTKVVSSSSGYIFTAKESMTLVANFRAVVPHYTLTLSAGPLAGGTVSGGGSFAGGTDVTARATPNRGYEFVSWTEGTRVVSSSASYSFSLAKNRNLTANFQAAAATYSLSLTSDPFFGGTAGGGGNFAPGTSVTIRAFPARGYEFVNWTEGGKALSKDISYKFTLSKDRSLTANFRQATATTYTVALAAAPAAGGTVSGGGTFNTGTTVTAHATPAAGYEFVNWTEGTTAVSTAASYVFTLSGSRTLTANFTVKTPVGDLTGTPLRVWPNPVTNDLRISGLQEKGLLKLADFSGRMVYETACSSSELVVPMGHFKPGIYLLFIETAEGRQIRKLVKR